MMYEKSVGMALDAELYPALHHWIDHDLSNLYNLDLQRREKPVLRFDDVFRLLQTHWGSPEIKYPSERQRLNVALMQQLSFFTATRPATLTHKPLNPDRLATHYIGQEPSSPSLSQSEQREFFKTLTYRDVSLFTLPNPLGPKDLITMQITLRYTKGWAKNPNPKKFILYEVDTLMFDATVLMIAIGFLDDAFRDEFSSVEDLYSVRTTSNRGSLNLSWKESILDVPIFRHPGSDCLRTSSCVQPIGYNTYLEYLRMLGKHTGFEATITPYAFRRGAGEAIEGVATQGQLQQVMNHRDAAFMSAATHLSRSANARAPVTAAPEDLKIVAKEYQLDELEQLRELLKNAVTSESGTLKAAR
ncbi:FluG domain-protein [Triangularia verruculosa]|uniref:FluG domain-protein n=1 Tax=Triangularia verruculosa TaxID=2587418 RepID=A0AAN6XBC7_9PEZI|nr:FluG domain-protein [Triangularia verruculosa]